MAATVLVVDDSPTVRRVVEAVLGSVGLRVVAAEGGADGLARARQERPDLILLDLVMPRMTGYQFCRRLLDDDELATIPVVIMTSKGEVGGDRFVAMPNVVDYVSKPFAPEVVLTLVTRTLEKYRSAPPRSGPRVEVEAIAERSGLHDAAQRQRLYGALVRALEQHGVERADELARALADELDDPFAAPTSLVGHPVVLWADLRRVALPELLQLVHLQARTGLMRLEGDGRRYDVYRVRGRVAGVRATR